MSSEFKDEKQSAVGFRRNIYAKECYLYRYYFLGNRKHTNPIIDEYTSRHHYFSDCWRSYSKLQDKGFVYTKTQKCNTTNHKCNFVDPNSGARPQKYKITKHNTKKHEKWLNFCGADQIEDQMFSRISFKVLSEFYSSKFYERVPYYFRIYFSKFCFATCLVSFSIFKQFKFERNKNFKISGSTGGRGLRYYPWLLFHLGGAATRI